MEEENNKSKTVCRDGQSSEGWDEGSGVIRGGGSHVCGKPPGRVH